MEDEINLLDYWRVLVKYKQLIVSLTVIAVATAFFYGLSQPKMYKATVSIMVVDTSGGGLVSSLTAIPVFGGFDISSAGEGKIVPILKSAALAKLVAESIDLKAYFPKIPANLSEEVKLRAAAAGLRGAVESKSGGGLLNISVIWPEPEQAADLANRYVDGLGKFLSRRSLNVNFLVIDPAIVPQSAFKPQVMQTLPVAAFLGLFLGVFAAFFLEYVSKLPRQS